MAKIAILTFKKNGSFTSEVCDTTEYQDKIKKPGVYGVIGLNEVVKEAKEETESEEKPEETEQ